VLEAGRRLCESVGAERGAPEAMTGTMITVRLPEQFGATEADSLRLRDALLFEDRIEIQLHAWHGRLWVRMSAQIYNDEQDLERLVNALAVRCPA
jgi:isopenicillin-N epimerase